MIKLSFVVAAFSIFLPLSGAKDASSDVPEAGFLSADRYTNAFFGFSLPLPKDPAIRIARISGPGSKRHLFGLAQEQSLTVFDISALQMMNRKDAERLMEGSTWTLISGKEFSRGAFEHKTPQGTVWNIIYWTTVNNYLLEFSIQSLDRRTTEELQHCVEQIRFFDPEEAQAIAGPNSRPYNPALSPHPKK